MQNEKQWKNLVDIMMDEIKGACRYFAGQGETSWSFRVEQIIKNCFEEPYVYIDRRYDEDRWIEEISFDDTQEGLLWESMRGNFFYCGNPQEDIAKAYGLEKEQAEKLGARLSDLLKKEGLTVEVAIKKTVTLNRIEKEYVEYGTKLEKMLAGQDGYMKKKYVPDKELFDVCCKVSW